MPTLHAEQKYPSQFENLCAVLKPALYIYLSGIHGVFYMVKSHDVLVFPAC